MIFIPPSLHFFTGPLDSLCECEYENIFEIWFMPDSVIIWAHVPFISIVKVNNNKNYVNSVERAYSPYHGNLYCCCCHQNNVIFGPQNNCQVYIRRHEKIGSEIFVTQMSDKPLVKYY